MEFAETESQRLCILYAVGAEWEWWRSILIYACSKDEPACCTYEFEYGYYHACFLYVMSNTPLRKKYPKIKESKNADFGKIKLLIRFHFILFLFHILFSVRVYYLVKSNLPYMHVRKKISFVCLSSFNAQTHYHFLTFPFQFFCSPFDVMNLQLIYFYLQPKSPQFIFNVR